MAAANRQGKMANLINYRMRVTLVDGRQMAGQMLAFDKHMNLVIADTEEFRRTRRKPVKAAPGSTAPTVETEERRSIGLTIIRGANVISLSVDGPPPSDPSARLGTTGGPGPVVAPATLTSGPGGARPVGRGLPPTLTGPAAGVGGPMGSFGGFPPPGGFAPPPGPPGFPGRGGPGGPPGFPNQFPPAGGPPPGFAQPPPFQPPPGQGRGYPPPGFSGR